MSKMHSVLTPGMCPPDLQQLRGKEISVGTTRHVPMIILDMEGTQVTGGAIKQIFDIYARKFDFTPKLRITSGFDNEEGLIPKVRCFKLLKQTFNTNTNFLFTRYTKKSLQLE